MFRTIRMLMGLASVALVAWCSFRVPLGDRTLVEHVRRIAGTNEAQDLIEGARSRVRPALDEATERLLGEHIEAPTQETGTGPTPRGGSLPRRAPAPTIPR